MILKCNYCRSNITIIGGDPKPGDIIGDCPTCRRGIGVVPGLKKKRRWWQTRTHSKPGWDADSHIPIEDGRPYTLDEVNAIMLERPFSLWAPADRIKWHMEDAYSFDGNLMLRIGADGEATRLPHGADDLSYTEMYGAWYELSHYKFYFRRAEDMIKWLQESGIPDF
jgi:hypothetical protein